MFSAGNPACGPGCESLVLTDAERGIYTRLVIAHNKIRGAIRYGDIRDGHWYLDLIEKGRDIRDIRAAAG